MTQTYQELYDCYAHSGSSSKENLLGINQCLRSGVWPIWSHRCIRDEGDCLPMYAVARQCRQAWCSAQGYHLFRLKISFSFLSPNSGGKGWSEKVVWRTIDRQKSTVKIPWHYVYLIPGRMWSMVTDRRCTWMYTTRQQFFSLWLS